MAKALLSSAREKERQLASRYRATAASRLAVYATGYY